MQRWLAVSLIWFSTITYCKPQHAPLPDGLVSAKTVFLVNNTGYQQDLDTAYSEFQKWGHFTIVSDRNNADVVVVFGRDAAMRGHETTGVTRMDVFLKGSDQPAFETTETIRGPMAGTSSVKTCIKD